MIHNLTIIISRPTTNLLLSSAKPSFQSKSPDRFAFFCCLTRTMQSSNSVRAAQIVHQVPEFGSDEIGRVAEQVHQSYSFDGYSRWKGKGVAIVWFRHDLRILDNEVLFKAWASSEAVLLVYCFDPRHFGTTHYFGFLKLELRALPKEKINFPGMSCIKPIVPLKFGDTNDCLRIKKRGEQLQRQYREQS